MKLYWYWPFVRDEELGLADAVLQAEDELVVQTLSRPSSPARSVHDDWSVVPDLPDVAAVSGGRARWVSSRARTYVGRLTARQALVSRYRPDLAHVMFLNHFTDSYALRRLARSTTLVSSVHDVVPHNQRLPDRLQHKVLRDLYGNAGNLVVHHDYVRNRLVDEYDVPAELVDVVPLQVPDFGARARTEAPSEAVVLFFGTFRHNKGVEVLLEAIRLLRDRPEFRFTFAGQAAPSEARPVLEAAGRDKRIVAELGWVSRERKSQLYARCRVVVLPYTSFASQSGVLHDAYGHGRPVVVSDVGALGDSVREDGTGWVVPPSRPGELASALEKALDAANEYSVVAEAASSLARARTPKLVGASLRSIYGRLLGED